MRYALAGKLVQHVICNTFRAVNSGFVVPGLLGRLLGTLGEAAI